MISITEKNYGKLLMFDFPWMDSKKGIGMIHAEFNLDKCESV